MVGNWTVGLRSFRYCRRFWIDIFCGRKGVICCRKYRILDWGRDSWVWEEIRWVWGKVWIICVRSWIRDWGRCRLVRLVRLGIWEFMRRSIVLELRRGICLCLGRMVVLVLRKDFSLGEMIGLRDGIIGGWVIGWMFCGTGL